MAPTHVIAGEMDILFPARFSRMMAEKIPGAKLAVFPESEGQIRSKLVGYHELDDYDRAFSDLVRWEQLKMISCD
jgi:hypothetical protein